MKAALRAEKLRPHDSESSSSEDEATAEGATAPHASGIGSQAGLGFPAESIETNKARAEGRLGQVQGAPHSQPPQQMADEKGLEPSYAQASESRPPVVADGSVVVQGTPPVAPTDKGDVSSATFPEAAQYQRTPSKSVPVGVGGSADETRTTVTEGIGPKREYAAPRGASTEDPKEGVVWLHGTIRLGIARAQNVPLHKHLYCNDPVTSGLDSCLGYLGNRRHAHAYVTLELGPARRARTRIIKHTSHPAWEESFQVPVADETPDIGFLLKDATLFGAPRIGSAAIPAAQLITGDLIEGWLDLKDEQGEPVKSHGKQCRLLVSLQYRSIAADESYGAGLGGSPKAGLVPNTYFPMRHGNKFHLYSDAHQDLENQPKIQLGNGSFYKASSAWDDLQTAIESAKHLIYITGWSLYDRIKLKRGHDGPMEDSPELTLGQLLKNKAREGVRVCLLIWDDKTSLNNPLIFKSGLMMTHDEDTRRYFRGTKVKCRLCPRDSGADESLVAWIKLGSMFTHHQKSVILDSQVEGESQRRLIAFMGGIDLCDGRYDDKNHWLFRTLPYQHSQDFHQACIANADITRGGPRQPWHDIHCQVAGPIAWDLLTNFVQRWRRQAGKLHQQDLLNVKNVNGLHVPQNAVGTDSDDTGDPRTFVTDPSKDPEAWNAQLFRSITSNSAAGLPAQYKDAARLGLSSGKGKVVDFSIQNAYVTAIRRAKRYLYIENQYFLGSSHAWPRFRGAGSCTHLVPIEIGLKIANQIRAGKPFKAYIVLPMWPEGIPDSGSVQEVLQWQTCTVRMMYGIVAGALQDVGSQAHPLDYLAFFCLGKREPRLEGEPDPPNLEDVKAGSPYERAQKARRFMIYVHSKLLICDDEYMIQGSANINQRSMDGSRDTELAVGAYQPKFSANNSSTPTARGQVYGFRQSLFEEHLGSLHESFADPSSEECMQEVRRRADASWQAFMSPQVQELPCHLMPYPFQAVYAIVWKDLSQRALKVRREMERFRKGVNRDGTVESIPGCENFPDTDALVLGKEVGSMPDTLTT